MLSLYCRHGCPKNVTDISPAYRKVLNLCAGYEQCDMNGLLLLSVTHKNNGLVVAGSRVWQSLPSLARLWCSQNSSRDLHHTFASVGRLCLGQFAALVPVKKSFLPSCDSF